jgi:hypothetical protein
MMEWKTLPNSRADDTTTCPKRKLIDSIISTWRVFGWVDHATAVVQSVRLNTVNRNWICANPHHQAGKLPFPWQNITCNHSEFPTSDQPSPSGGTHTVDQGVSRTFGANP